ncbi:ABC transporter ATP-binding protein [Algihabitans albus]|uniref:ABC transporter ATP-binding protein n=1 Tax=Algihabitans albus TaxID=2164067 RepID=UPI001F36BBCB|nr:ABC transporter ATP-binding protein [Algihabitans albus]
MTDIASSPAAPPRDRVAAPLVEAEGLSVSFAAEFGSLPAVRGVDLRLESGEILGLVGESGSGKSVTCQALLGLLPASSTVTGRLRVAGETLAAGDAFAFERLRGDTISMIFQDPMSALDPLMTGRAHLYQRLRRHGLQGDGEERARELLHQAGIADAARVLDAYPHQLSGGLCQRVVIALALAGGPQVLIADEPTTALDVTVQAQVLDLLEELRRTRGLAVILISHDLGVVAEICDRIAVMYAGQIVETGPTEAVLRRPAHPYTLGLLASRPSLSGPRRELRAIRGSAPTPDALPTGCTFAPRCDRGTAVCRAPAELLSLRSGLSQHRLARCHLPLTEDAHG